MLEIRATYCVALWQLVETPFLGVDRIKLASPRGQPISGGRENNKADIVTTGVGLLGTEKHKVTRVTLGSISC